MLPTLSAGQTVLVNPRAYRRSPPVAGDVVLFYLTSDADSDVIIKRATSVDEAGVFVRGDNADQSTDSRDFGVVAHPRVIGRVECTFP